MIVAVIVYLRWHAHINLGIAAALRWLFQFLRDPKTCRVAETFCNEVAVLWFVFPLLDSIYEHWKDADDKSKIGGSALPPLHQAFWVAGLFFLFALILSHVGGTAEDLNHE